MNGFDANVSTWASYNVYLAHVIASLPPESSGYSMNLNQVLGPGFESTYPKTPFDRAPE